MLRGSALAVVVLVLGVFAAGCGGDDEDSNAAWADDVCGSVSSWVDSVREAADSVTQGGGSVDDAVDDVKSATEQLDDDLRGLEPPEAAEQLQDTIEQLLDQLRQGVRAIEDAVENASGGGAIEALTTIAATISTMSQEVSSAVDDLQEADTGETLRQAFEDSDDCRELREQQGS
jgi:methyl-accepting chemotaxis protein